MMHPAPIDKQLCFALYCTSLAMTQLYKSLLEPIGLTYPQYLVMLILWEEDSVSLKTIGGQLGQKSGSLTPVLKRLEQDGFVERVRDASDERALNIKLTDKGEALRQKASSIGPAIADASGLQPSEMTALRNSLEKLRENLMQSEK
ncbi:MarR family winged helix-turn-helix transcriptional regulator [Cohaesibacter celericrescens]|uniref:MarR family transcriptional regulator n=1 Tax=Cohaesibacter celericrescens TaxID=2067669 RepID=A0A2N5XKL4_9HYPH|nr:MarR family transcriptional regulator [Cohaesibacter celericrescens]PLW75061.1 MarR family transcriptional regulator [Cohaesibacter celericrescens]